MAVHHESSEDRYQRFPVTEDERNQLRRDAEEARQRMRVPSKRVLRRAARRRMA